MVIEYLERGRTKQVVVTLTKVLNGYVQMESEKGLALFSTESGKGHFLYGSKNIMMLFSKGVKVNLTPKFLETLKKELEGWKTI